MCKGMWYAKKFNVSDIVPCRLHLVIVDNSFIPKWVELSSKDYGWRKFCEVFSKIQRDLPILLSE